MRYHMLVYINFHILSFRRFSSDRGESNICVTLHWHFEQQYQSNIFLTPTTWPYKVSDVRKRPKNKIDNAMTPNIKETHRAGNITSLTYRTSNNISNSAPVTNTEDLLEKFPILKFDQSNKTLGKLFHHLSKKKDKKLHPILNLIMTRITKRSLEKSSPVKLSG